MQSLYKKYFLCAIIAFSFSSQVSGANAQADGGQSSDNPHPIQQESSSKETLLNSIKEHKKETFLFCVASALMARFFTKNSTNKESLLEYNIPEFFNALFEGEWRVAAQEGWKIFDRGFIGQEGKSDALTLGGNGKTVTGELSDLDEETAQRIIKLNPKRKLNLVSIYYKTGCPFTGIGGHTYFYGKKLWKVAGLTIGLFAWYHMNDKYKPKIAELFNLS